MNFNTYPSYEETRFMAMIEDRIAYDQMCPDEGDYDCRAGDPCDGCSCPKCEELGDCHVTIDEEMDDEL